MKSLVILSDINGMFLSKAIMDDFCSGVSKRFNAVHETDSLRLAGISVDYEKEKKHRYLIETGIDKAARALTLLYPSGISVGVGLSVGGTILWRAIQQGLSIDYLICFSSTRLRFETKALSCKMNLFFGEHDEFKPSKSWYTELGIKENLVPNQGHEFYRSQTGIDIFCDELKNFDKIRTIAK